MQLKRLAVASPSGNVTALVFDQLLDLDRTDLDKLITKSWSLKNNHQHGLEQCCFITLPKSKKALARVEMFGGEFCGNASRSAIWLITKGQDSKGLIEVSGTSKALAFEVKNEEVSVEMPLPEEEVVEKVAEGTLVHLDGITHLVVTDPTIISQTNPESLLNILQNSNTYKSLDHPAFAVTFFNKTSKKAQFCVWVKKLDKAFNETACGSGTCSIGIAVAYQNKATTTLDVIQPTGERITCHANFNPITESISYSNISGKVTILFDGPFELV